MIERSHLKILRALAEHGSLTAAASSLFVTQSALSHQMRYLEKKLEVTLWERQGRKLRLTQAGDLLLTTAKQVLPVLEQAETTLKALGEGRQGVLRLGVECHPCYKWLKGILAEYLVAMPKMDVDIVHKFQFSGLDGLLNYHIDLLVTPDPLPQTGLYYAPLFDYELVLLVSHNHPLAAHSAVTAQQLAQQTLLTFPVAEERLDIYSQFLRPAGINPRHKTMESLDLMIQMVGLNRGVTVLPDWLAESLGHELPVTRLKLGKKGLMKTLYAGLREQDKTIPYMQAFIELGQQHQ